MIKSLKAADISACFPELLRDAVGDTDRLVTSVCSPTHAAENSIVFVTEPKLTETALASAASTVVLSLKAKPVIESMPKSDSAFSTKTFFFSPNVKLAMALVKMEFFNLEIPLQPLGTIHPTAVIDPTAKLGSAVAIGPFCVIGRNVTIGNHVRIDASVVIEADAKIGNYSHLQSHLYIGPRTQVGERCLLMPNSTIGAEGFGFAPDSQGHFHRILQTGKVVLHDDVEIGANCTVDRGTFGATEIGEGTKIDKLSHIAHNCVIGKHCAMAGKFAIAGSGKIGDHVIVGGRVTIKDGVSVVSKVEIAGLAGVQSNITEPGAYGGFPVQPVRDFMRTGASLAHLPQLRKDVARLLKHLGL